MISDFISLQKDEEKTDSGFSFDYHFNEKEIKVLARMFRKNQNSIPEELEDFAKKVEFVIYSNMSIDEVEKFYK